MMHSGQRKHRPSPHLQKQLLLMPEVIATGRALLYLSHTAHHWKEPDRQLRGTIDCISAAKQGQRPLL